MLRMGEHMILSMYLFLDRASLTPLSAPREATQRQKFGGTPFPGALIFKGRHKNAGLLAHSVNRVFCCWQNSGETQYFNIFPLHQTGDKSTVI